MTDHYIYCEIQGSKRINRSQTSDPIPPENVDSEHEVITVDDSTIGGVWNEDTYIFDPRPEIRSIDKLDFLDLFTAPELEGILASSHIKVKVFIEKLSMAPNSFDLKSTRMVTAVNGMAQLNLITAARAAEILDA